MAIEIPGDIDADLPEDRRLKPIETAIVLGPLAVLFALFVAVQVRYLFGGEEVVQRSLDLSYAQYARRGYFELVLASLLLLPVLASVNWARRQDFTSTRLFAGLALVLVALLFVVMASAWQRLHIYMDTYGLTELRLYPAASLAWLAVTFVWFLINVALQRRQDFFAGAVIAGIVAILALNLLSPDAVIARTNTDRLAAGRSFDAEYATSLSADAIPVLVHRLDRLPLADRCAVATSLRERWTAGSDDLRSWNLSRREARHTIETNEADLEAACR